MRHLECTETTWLSNDEYFRHFNTKSAQSRIPLSGSFDLTHRCNFRCVHCYLGDRSDRMLHEEMSTKHVVSVLDQITEAGCLYFLITGGEPLLRKDFPEIYRHAKEKGLLISIFTNGTLITDNLLDLFHDLPPRVVEISLYGATSATYEKITGVPGSYKKCINGIERLLDYNINVRLKTVLMTVNSHEFFDIETMAKDYGVKFRFDAALFPCFNGNKSPLDLRVSPEDAIEKEFSDEERVSGWKKLFERFKVQSFSENLYSCGAGVTGFHIDPYGTLKPCLMINNITYNLTQGSFLTGWNEAISKIRDKKAGKIFHCNKCEKILFCNGCPSLFALESGQEDVRSEYICKMGNLRFEKIQNGL